MNGKQLGLVGAVGAFVVFPAAAALAANTASSPSTAAASPEQVCAKTADAGTRDIEFLRDCVDRGLLSQTALVDMNPALAHIVRGDDVSIVRVKVVADRVLGLGDRVAVSTPDGKTVEGTVFQAPSYVERSPLDSATPSTGADPVALGGSNAMKYSLLVRVPGSFPDGTVLTGGNSATWTDAQ